MIASILTNQLEAARDGGYRIAIGFQHRLMMIDSIAELKVIDLLHSGSGNDAAYEVVGMLYDTAHSRNATPERAFFESSEVVYAAVPANPSTKGPSTEGPSAEGGA